MRILRRRREKHQEREYRDSSSTVRASCRERRARRISSRFPRLPPARVILFRPARLRGSADRRGRSRISGIGDLISARGWKGRRMDTRLDRTGGRVQPAFPPTWEKEGKSRPYPSWKYHRHYHFRGYLSVGNKFRETASADPVWIYACAWRTTANRDSTRPGARRETLLLSSKSCRRERVIKRGRD